MKPISKCWQILIYGETSAAILYLGNANSTHGSARVSTSLLEAIPETARGGP
jgi:hypothetical protein